MSNNFNSSQDSLLELLLSLPNLTDDEQLFLLAGKIILYYAESELVSNRDTTRMYKLERKVILKFTDSDDVSVKI